MVEKVNDLILKASNKYSLQRIMDDMPNNVYWLNRDCVTVGCNKNTLKFIGLEKLEDFVGITYERMAQLAGWEPIQAQRFKDDDLEVMSSGIAKYNVEEEPFYDKEGNPVYYMSSRVPIISDDGEVIGVVGISVDITDRKKIELKLLETQEKLSDEKRRADYANQSKSELISKICTDIRTSLTAAVPVNELLSKKFDKTDYPEVNDMISVISDCFLKIKDNLDDIVDYNEIASGHEFDSEKSDLFQLIESEIENRSSQAEKNEVEIIFYNKVHSHVFINGVECVRYLLSSVLSYVVSMYHGRRVVVSANISSRSGNDVIIELYDASKKVLNLEENFSTTLLEKFAKGAGGEIIESTGNSIFTLSLPFFCEENLNKQERKLIQNNIIRENSFVSDRVKILVIDSVLERANVFFNEFDGFVTLCLDKSNVFDELKSLPNIIVVNDNNDDVLRTIEKFVLSEYDFNPIIVGFCDVGLNLPFEIYNEGSIVTPDKVFDSINKLWKQWPDKLKALKPSVLIVEDNPLNEKAERLILQELQCNVSSSSNVKGALSLIKENGPYDIALVDFRLGSEKGTDLIELLSKERINQETKFVIVSAYLTEDDMNICSNLPIEHILIKPVSIVDVKKVLISLM